MKNIPEYNKHIEEDVIVDWRYPTNPRFNDLSGSTFGRLKVLHYAGKNKAGILYYWCQCKCGNELYVRMSSLISGNTESCGCIHKEMLQERLTTHGDTNSRLYRMYYAMIARCKYKNHIHHELYYDKGIRVCDEWQPENNGFENFKKWAYEEADPGYSDYYEEHPEVWISIEREDSDKNYCPENCSFANGKTQANNTSRNAYKRFKNYVFTMMQWSEILNIPYSELKYRNDRYWTDFELIATPYNPDDIDKSRIPNPNIYSVPDIPLDYLKYNKYKKFIEKGLIDKTWDKNKSYNPMYDEIPTGTSYFTLTRNPEFRDLYNKYKSHDKEKEE